MNSWPAGPKDASLVRGAQLAVQLLKLSSVEIWACVLVEGSARADAICQAYECMLLDSIDDLGKGNKELSVINH